MGKLPKHGNRRAEAAALRASFEPIQRRMDATATWNSRGRSNGYAVQPSASAAATAVAALRPGLGLASKKAAEEAVKALQRADPAGNALWWAFCDRYGGGVRDPCKHKLSFLHKFLLDFTNADLDPSSIENDFEASQTQSLARQRILHSGASQTCPELPEIIEDNADFFNKESFLDAINRAGLGDSLRNLQACAGDSPESIREMRRAMLHEVTMKLQSMIGKEAMDSLETRLQMPVKEVPQDDWHIEDQAPSQRMMPQETSPQQVMTVPELSAIETEQYHRAMTRTCPGSLPSLEGIPSSASSSAAPESFTPVGGREPADFHTQPLRVDTSQLQECGVGSFISASPKVRPSLQEKKILKKEPCLGQALMRHGRPSHDLIRPDYLRSSGRIGEARTCPELPWLPLVFEDSSVVMRMCL